MHPNLDVKKTMSRARKCFCGQYLKIKTTTKKVCCLQHSLVVMSKETVSPWMRQGRQTLKRNSECSQFPKARTMQTYQPSAQSAITVIEGLLPSILPPGCLLRGINTWTKEQLTPGIRERHNVQLCKAGQIPVFSVTSVDDITTQFIIYN